MGIRVNLRHLEEHDLQLNGQLPVSELDIDGRDEVIQAIYPLDYDLVVQQMEGGLLVQGTLRLPLKCHCVRCLKPFQYELRVSPYSTHIPLEGEDAVAVTNDCVDLTATVREDILLEFPQHPLCDQECKGLPQAAVARPEDVGSDQADSSASAWAELNKLKF